ncbi:MAG: hypothetical protein ACR2JH_00110 [Solirubrobacteraceae bacterium]
MTDEKGRRRTNGRRVRLVDVAVEVVDVDTEVVLGDRLRALLELGAWLPPQPASAYAMTAAAPHSWARSTSAQRR